MIEYFAANIWLFWIIIAVICLIMELTTGGFFLLCFSIGAIITLLISFLLPFSFQVLLYGICSCLCLFLVRPALLKLEKRKTEGIDNPGRISNADALIGAVGIVCETIPYNGYGRVLAGGDDWKAQGKDGLSIEKNCRVKVVDRDSLIVTVEKI